MTDRTASNTAMGVAWVNAAHQVIDSSPRILDDPVIVRLVGATVEAIAERRERFQAPWARVLRAHVVLRTRFAEERLEEAIQRGVRQYVILGAGFETFAYRQPAWATSLRVFEVDQPGTQAVKRQRLMAAGVAVPGNVTYVPVDFESESLADGLRRGGVQLDQPAFFAWLGVTMYLTEPAIDAVLRTVVALPPSTEIAFTFAQPRQPESDASRGSSLAERAAAVGEPWVTFFEPDALERKLTTLGFSTARFLAVPEASALYFQNRADNLSAPTPTSIVTARV
jgi:methyltransferase (TIGR00027 family)